MLVKQNRYKVQELQYKGAFDSIVSLNFSRCVDGREGGVKAIDSCLNVV